MSTDPKRFVNTASGIVTAAQATLDFELDAILESNPPSAKMIYDLVPKFALLPKNEWLGIRGKIRRRFAELNIEKEIRIRELEVEIGLAREKLRSTERITSPRAERQLDRPTIQVKDRELHDLSAEAMQALREANDPPSLYVRSGEMVYVGVDERSRPSIIPVSHDHLRGRMARTARYIRAGENADLAVPPPIENVRDILALPVTDWGLPALDVVVEVPTLRPDGTVLDTPGYDEASRTLYLPADGLKMRPIPDKPASEDVEAAVNLIDEAVIDFPFLEEADENGNPKPNSSRANFFALLLSPLIRPAISGCTPLALIDAPQAGTGKSLLADVFSKIVTGRPAAMTPFPRDEAEVQKSITSTLMAGRPLICFDNFEGILNSTSLALALTAKEYSARILGKSEDMMAKNLATWLLTGNNIRPSGDMPRRCYHIRIDAKSSRPYAGRKKEFKHPNLLEWIDGARPDLLWALLTIARSWFAWGRRDYVPKPLGSFEGWHRTVAGILASCGVEGFLGNMETFLAEGDENALQWESFLADLSKEYGDWFTTGMIADRIRMSTQLQPCPFTIPDSLADVDRRKEAGLERALGRSFAKRQGARFGDRQFRLERRVTRTRVSEWRVASDPI